MGSNSSYYYNLFVVASITKQGQSAIGSAILLFEGFLAGNVQYGSLDEIIEYIHNVVNEDRVYNDKVLLDGDISIEQCWMKIMLGCGFNHYIPSEEDMTIVWNILLSCTQEDINRLYYKNNLYEFCNNRSIQNGIIYILEKMDKPFLNPNIAPEEIQVELDELKKLMYEYVYYRHLYIDKIERVAIMYKKASVLTDTDSSMISLDAWYRFVLGLVYDKDLKIKTQYVDKSKFEEEDEIEIVDEEKSEVDYDFYTDEFIEMKSAAKTDKIIPQMGLRHSICNVMLYIVSELSKDYMQYYSGCYGAYDDNRCKLILKNEMFMKRIMIRTSGRKQYAYYLEVTEGNLVPKNAAVGLTGLEMNKSTMSSAVRDKLKKILLDNVLEPEQIDQRKLLTEIIKFEKEIYRSLMNKETKYYKPVTFKSMDAYTDPFALPPIKGAMVYNATKDEDLAPFDLHQRNSALLVKVKINGYNIEPLKDSNPKVYYALEKLLGKKEFKVKGILVYAIPYDTEIPDWLLDYIDYYTIINDVIKNFPLESVGLIGRAGNDSVNHSNILKIV